MVTGGQPVSACWAPSSGAPNRACIVASTLWAYAFVALPTMHWARFASMGAMLASLLFAGRWVSNMVTWATRREM